MFLLLSQSASYRKPENVIANSKCILTPQDCAYVAQERPCGYQGLESPSCGCQYVSLDSEDSVNYDQNCEGSVVSSLRPDQFGINSPVCKEPVDNSEPKVGSEGSVVSSVHPDLLTEAQQQS